MASDTSRLERRVALEMAVMALNADVPYMGAEVARHRTDAIAHTFDLPPDLVWQLVSKRYSAPVVHQERRRDTERVK